MFGFDVLVDRNLKPHLLEVNFAPSLNTDSSLDLSVKSRVRESETNKNQASQQQYAPQTNIKGRSGFILPERSFKHPSARVKTLQGFHFPSRHLLQVVADLLTLVGIRRGSGHQRSRRGSPRPSAAAREEGVRPERGRRKGRDEECSISAGEVGSGGEADNENWPRTRGEGSYRTRGSTAAGAIIMGGRDPETPPARAEASVRKAMASEGDDCCACACDRPATNGDERGDSGGRAGGRRRSRGNQRKGGEARKFPPAWNGRCVGGDRELPSAEEVRAAVDVPSFDAFSINTSSINIVNVAWGGVNDDSTLPHRPTYSYCSRLLYMLYAICYMLYAILLLPIFIARDNGRGVYVQLPSNYIANLLHFHSTQASFSRLPSELWFLSRLPQSQRKARAK